MKILFLCGCLEPGRDGVGDYVRRLGVELAQQGHPTAGIALADQFLTEEQSTSQPTENGDLAVLRLPAAWPASRRFGRAQQRVAEFDPEWVSLQFVPFSFQAKGLPFLLAKQLLPLGKGRSWHIMFHELWVGMDEESTAKFIWWGRVQRQLIKALLRRLQPKVIHTQTPLYHSHLARLGFSSELLPLFANISNSQAPANEAAPPSAAAPAQGVGLVAFGTIHPGARIAELARDAAQYAAEHAVPVSLTLVGRGGEEQARWAATWQAAGLPVHVLGEQAPDQISAALRAAALGVTTTALALIGKSGTAAAMQEHGLPVLSIARPWVPLDVPDPATPVGVFAYRPGNLAAFLTKSACTPVYDKLFRIARQFADALRAVPPQRP
ncbi:MAG: glycosyltransferase family 1 protein [Hymenobacter sp.]|nr:MAG: glycosyltransferase family 1 protein [Hymenobacter sp.]